MALWNEKPMSASAGSAVTPSAPLPERSLPERNTSDPALAVSPRRPTPKTSSEGGESVIAANLTIEKTTANQGQAYSFDALDYFFDEEHALAYAFRWGRMWIDSRK